MCFDQLRTLTPNCGTLKCLSIGLINFAYALQQRRKTFADAKLKIKVDILKYDSTEIGSDHVDNVFKYVMPKNVLITRNDKDRQFAVMCNYKFDMEHGLAVVFENEEFKTVGAQDIIL